MTGHDTEAAARIAATAAALEAAARAAGMWLTADLRIGEVDAAEMIGLAAPTLANRRAAGTAPPHYRIGGGGHRVSYRLNDLARFIEFLREP